MLGDVALPIEHRRVRADAAGSCPEMPPACPVDGLRSPLLPALRAAPKCHRLARWMFTFVATARPPRPRNATGLPGGCLRSAR